jgi:2-polyprenyl-6-methoxyphenol hydroxylase-like FAD-dependent oxidoreductase
MGESFDAVVVGGGLGGATAAALLAQAGIDVLVVERERMFRDRVRGEWLAPWGLLELQELGLRQVADAVPHVNLISRHVPYDESIPPDVAEQNAVDLRAVVVTGGCLAIGHPQFQEAMLAHAAASGATVRRGVDAVRVTPGRRPTVRYEYEGVTHDASCRLVVAADGRESAVRKSLGIELASTEPMVMMAGILIDGLQDWPAEQQADGVAGDFNFLVFPQADGRCRLYGAWDVNQPHRFSGPGREQRFLNAFRVPCLPEGTALASATPAGPLAGCPMTDTWTDTVAVDGVILIGDAAGWSDPIIGQGMAVTFRDVHLVADVLTAGPDWSPAAFQSYADERKERMRRLRFASAGLNLTNSFGDEARARRVRLQGLFLENPAAAPLATALLGPWVLPEEAYSDEAWDVLTSV